jgi:8-oxo-dGTP pyrophosphatase MutT (NUDIX family)
MTKQQFPTRAFQSQAQGNSGDVRDAQKVCLFVTHNGCLLFIVRHHQEDNSVSIEPSGGKVDFKRSGGRETHNEALIREAKEELGIVIAPQGLLSVENHPFTHKPVAYYACSHVEGVPFNAADREHIGVIEIPLGAAQAYADLQRLSLEGAQRIVAEKLSQPLSRPIEFRVPEGAVMNFLQQHVDEPGAAFSRVPEGP